MKTPNCHDLLVRCSLWLQLGLASGLAIAETPVPASYKAVAEVNVTTAVAAPNPGGWTATFVNPPVENLLNGGEYEPFNFRTRFYAGNDGRDTIPVEECVATGYDCRREGFFDGATARVYRIVSGRLVNVRRDVVARHRASGWSATLEGKLVPPGLRRFQWSFDEYNSPVAPYFFTVVAVGEDGTWSKPAPAVEVMRPAKCQVKANNEGLKAFRVATSQSPAPGAVPASPVNFRSTTGVDGVVTLAWDDVAAPGIAGYLVLRSDYPPERHHGYGFDLVGKAKTPDQQIKRGDLVFLDLRRNTWSRNQYAANRVWNVWGEAGMPQIFPGQPGESTNHTWALVPHPGPFPAAFTASERGRTCLEITMKGSEKLELSQYNYANAAQDWYPVLAVGRPYVVEFWAREKGMGKPTVRFGVSQVYEQAATTNITLSGEWTKYSFEFTPDREFPTNNQCVGQTLLSFAGPGTLWLDGWRIYPRDKGYMAVSPEDIADLRASGMSFLRTHTFIKSGWSYFLDDLTCPPGQSASRGTTQGTPPTTLFSALDFMKRAGVSPWLQIEMSLSEEEWQGLVEYLAAPYDPAKDTPQAKPWAYRRYALGQVRPWLDEFSKVIFEVSNETWNPMRGFAPWNFPWQKMTDAATGRVYSGGELTGLMTGYILEQMKRSPYWTTLGPRLEPAVGGWLCELGDSGFGQSACKVCPEIKHNLVANYNGGWDEGAAPAKADDKGYRLALTAAPQAMGPTNRRLAETRDRLSRQGVYYKVGTYEAGPGYALPNTISKAQEESESQVMKSLAAGTGTLDCFLDGAQQGLVLQNFFTYQRGRTYWTSHAEPRRGGQAYPSWMGLVLYNRYAQGDFLVTQVNGVPTDRLEKTQTRNGMEAAPLLGVYATRQGDRYGVFLLSRKLDNYPYAGDDGYTPVTLHLPFRSVKSVTLYKMEGAPRANNLDSEAVKVQAQEIPVREFSPTFTLNAARGADVRGMPPAATYLYVFEGVKTPALPSRVSGAITPAPGQPLTTSRPMVRFQVLFDRPVKGLNADAVKVVGTAGGTARVEWPAELGGTGFMVTVGDLESSGDVGLELPAGAVTDAAGSANAALAGVAVRYEIPKPRDQVLISENFEPVAGQTLWTIDGGTGWKGKWVLHNEDPAKYATQYALATQRPLEYPGLASSPAYVEGGVHYSALWRWLDVEGALAPVQRIAEERRPAQVGLSGATLWMSFLVRKEKDDDQQAMVSLNADDFYKDEFGAVRFGFNEACKKDGTRLWSMQVRNAGNKGWSTIPTAAAIEPGKTVLIVVRLVFGRRDAVAMYVNPPLGGPVPGTPSAEFIADPSRKLMFRNVIIWAGAPGSCAFDEIRMGDSFKAVTPQR